MANESPEAHPRSRRISRRALLASSGLALATLAACGDESNTRQFAGGPQTPDSQATPETALAQSVMGSPTSQPAPISIGELLEPHGSARMALIVGADMVTAIDIQSGDSQIIWQNEDRDIWAVTTDRTAERFALLTAPAGLASSWSIDFVDASGEEADVVFLGERAGTPAQIPDAVAAGRGGLDWIGESDSVAVGLPTGGLQQVFSDGSQIPLLSAVDAKRPAAIAVTEDAGTIAFVNQPSGSEGSGIYAGSMKAKPVDPIVVLPADRSGNRYARGVAWVSPGNRVATVIDREEVGTPQGDLFFIDTDTGVPQLAWTSPTGRVVWSVESFAISDDGAIVAFLTNPSNPETRKMSSVWVMQIDGGTIERFALPVELEESRLVFSPSGVAVSGLTRPDDEGLPLGAAFLVSSTGEIVSLYQETVEASPVASPVASPAASAVASPLASPELSSSPLAVTNGK